jgi:hypothetical protein
MSDPHQSNQRDKERESLQHQQQREKDLHRGQESKPPEQPGSREPAPLPGPQADPWTPKDPKALHPDIVKKEANMALHAMRPQPRAADIDVVLLVMWTDHEHEYTEIDAIHKAAVAKFKELFPLTNPAVAAG